MYYLLLIHAAADTIASLPPDEIGATIEAVDRFDREISDAGQNLGSVRLAVATTAVTVRVRDGKTVATDGPFAETKEQLGGIYLIDVAGIDEAVEVASRLPTAKFCAIEVRLAVGVDLRRAVSPDAAR